MKQNNIYYGDVIDMYPTDSKLSTYVINPETKKSDVSGFVVSTLKDGIRLSGVFFIWTLKNMFILMRETLKMAAEGNREMNEEIRNSQNRGNSYDDRYVHNGRTLKKSKSTR